MASKTDKTEMKRLKRNKRMGGKRKSKLRTSGSTKSPADLFGDKK
jgi:hypothetical protein